MPPRPDTVDHYTINCDDIPTILGADKCHKDGINGEGIVVGIVDSGYYDHKFFEIKRTEYEQVYHTKGWNYPTQAFPPVMSVTGQYMKPDPEMDRSGHGTGMAANLYSVAPRAQLRIYPTQSFMQSLEAAVEQCQIISLSKHNDVTGHQEYVDRYRAALRKARDDGKVVVHAAGNGPTTPWPVLNCPETVIKVGGVHRRQDGTLEASDYARANTGDRQSDLCGLCGMMPAGAYIWLPADPDNNAAQQVLPGWNLASGTSSATPQVAGVIALMQQARARNGMAPLNLETAKSLLRRTATPVNVGHSYDNVAADPAWCALVNAEAAVRMAVQ
jgi:subtilisin family serine protease